MKSSEVALVDYHHHYFCVEKTRQSSCGHSSEKCCGSAVSTTVPQLRPRQVNSWDLGMKINAYVLHYCSSFGGALPLRWRVGDQPSDSGLGNQLIHVCAPNDELGDKPSYLGDRFRLLTTNCERMFKRSATALATLSLYIHPHDPQETIARYEWSLTHMRDW